MDKYDFTNLKLVIYCLTTKEILKDVINMLKMTSRTDYHSCHLFQGINSLSMQVLYSFKNEELWLCYWGLEFKTT